jgi:hypothetical protein
VLRKSCLQQYALSCIVDWVGARPHVTIMEPSVKADPSPSYIAQQPAGVFGPPRWVIYSADGAVLTMFEPHETRDDVGRWLATKGLVLLTSNKLASSGEFSPAR